MPISPEEKEMRERMRRLETLVQEVENFKDEKAKSKTREMIQLLMDLHGASIERLLENIAASTASGTALIHALAKDEIVAGLMLLYGQHPIDLETRVRQALEQVRPFLRSHGGNVDLLGIEDGTIRLRLQGSCHGCPSSALTLKTTIEEAILEKAPDAAAIVVEGEVEHIGHAPGEGADGNGNGHGHFSLPVLAAR